MNNRPQNSEQQLHRKAVYVFPFVLVAGITNITEAGERNWKSRVDDYTSFVMVLNGKENAIAVWDQSTLAVKDKKSENPLKGFVGRYQVGTYYNGYVEQDTATTSIGPLVGDEVFKSLKHRKDVTITFGYDSYKQYKWIWDPSNEDMYHLYIVPELFGNQWMRISNVNKYYKTNKVGIKKLDRVDVTFSTIADELSDTGGVKRQFINTGSPGEGYAWPSIDENRNISLDIERLKERPITSFQIRTDGAGAPSSIYFMGRPCFNDSTNFDGISEKRILPPRRILAYRMTGSIMPKITLTGTASDNYYYCANANMVLDEAYDTWKEKIGDTYNLLQSQNFEGGISIGNTLDIAKIKQTNDWENTTTKKYPNNIKDDPTIKVTAEYDAAASPYLDVDRKVGKFKLDGYFTYAELLNHNAFINDQVIRQRNTIRNVTTWSLSRIPIVGGFLNFVVAGADYGWNNVKVILPTPAFGTWFACELLDLAVLQGTNDVNYLPCDFFRNNTESDLTQKAGVGNLSTAFRFFITDLYYNDGNDQDIKETIYLCQKKDENGQAMTPVQLWKPTSKPQYRGALDDTRGKCYGYIIDYICPKLDYSGDYTITFFNDDVEQDPVPVAEWRLISKGKTSGSMREWTNDMRLSFWEPNFTTDGEFPWPEAIQFPPPVSAEVNQDLEIRPDQFGGVYTATHSYGTNRTGLYNHFSDWDDFKDNNPWDKNSRGLYYYNSVTHEWNKYFNMRDTNTSASTGYFKQKGPFTSSLRLSKEQLLYMFNALVEQQAVISDLQELRRSFKRVKIGIKMDWFGSTPNYKSTAADATYREFTLTIDEFLGSYQKADSFEQHNTLTRSFVLSIDGIIPKTAQWGGKVLTNGVLTVDNGVISYTETNWQLSYQRIYQLGDTNYQLSNNWKNYKYKVEKILFLKV